MKNATITAVAAAIQTFIMAAVQFGEAFGWYSLSDGQRAAITGLWVALVGVWVAVANRATTNEG